MELVHRSVGRLVAEHLEHDLVWGLIQPTGEPDDRVVGLATTERPAQSIAELHDESICEVRHTP
jgi:hypothetical protein